MKSNYYAEGESFNTEDTIPDRMGKGSSIEEFMKFGAINITNGKKRIKESMRDILYTPIGTRFFQPQYGSKLYLVVFEQNDYIAKDMAVDYCREALQMWEPRITIKSLYAEIEDLKLNVYINYIVNDLGTPGSYVYTIERKIPPLR